MHKIMLLRIKYAACEICSVIIRSLSRVAMTALTDGVSYCTDAKRRGTDVGKYVCICIYFADK